MMARSLLIGWNEMTDKTMPDEPGRRIEADSPTEPIETAGDAPAPSAASPSDAVWPDFGALSERKRTAAGSRLITAVEIQNFKGIGRPMRVDLRPVTLLFGNNSAGKSTVLHAVCYAHEILNHRDVDAHTTERGGDRIDLGGFHNFVHAHDPARTVRLRFDLNLAGWNPPGLSERLVPPYSEFEPKEAIDALVLEVTSGWVELQVERRGAQPVLASYEVGVNETLVGCIRTRRQQGVVLEFNPAHPLLLDIPNRARATCRATNDVQGASRVAVFGLTSALPRWNEPLLLDERELDDTGSNEDASAVFRARVSALFVGIGQALRDELKPVRYIGPVRDLHPQTTIASSARRRAFETFAADFIHGGDAGGIRQPYPASWADGSRAWTYLHTTPHRDLLDAVNTWIERRDRLDTGYALRVRSKVTIYEDEAELVSELRKYHQLRQTFANPDGSVDLNGWVRAEAATIVDMTDPEDTKVALKRCDQLREQFAGADGASITESVDELVKATLQGDIEKFSGPEPIDIEPGIRREAERNLRLAENVRRLLSLTTQEIALQITDAGEDMAGSSEPLTPSYGRRLNDLLRRWESNAPKWIYAAGVLDGLRAMHVPDDLPDELEARTRRIEDALTSKDPSVEVEQFLSEFRRALQASVASARRNYRRLTALVARMEAGKFSSHEIEALAAGIAARSQREIDLLTTRNSVPVRIADVGVGISQVLPVVVAALDPDRPGITAIEQPELHLHPRIQVELGDLFASQAARGGIFLIETHSEHLLLRFMKRMRQTYDGTLGNGNPRMRPEDIAVYFVEIDPDGTETLIREMPLNERGDLVEAWPGGFFEEDLREIF